MTASIPGRVDVVVIGGGVIGLSVAFELARLGRRPLVLERGRRGGESSWAAAGMLAPVSEVEVEDAALIDLALDSLHRYPAFVERIESVSGGSCRFRTDGTLWVALDRDQLLEVERLAETMRLRSLAASHVGAEEILRREPHLSGRVLGGLRVEGDLQVDPRALLGCLAESIARLGGEVRSGAEATGVERRGPGVLVVHGEAARRPFAVEASCVVACAGAWTDAGLSMPVERIGIRPVKGQVVRLKGEPLVRHVIRNPECYLVPREDGGLVLGATMEEQGFEEAPTAGAVLDLLRHAFKLLPGIYDLEIEELCVGFRPATEDQRPVVGETDVEGLFLATGHFRHGVLLAPATAHYLVAGIEAGRMPEVLSPFALARLRGNRVSYPKGRS